MEDVCGLTVGVTDVQNEREVQRQGNLDLGTEGRPLDAALELLWVARIVESRLPDGHDPRPR